MLTIPAAGGMSQAGTWSLAKPLRKRRVAPDAATSRAGEDRPRPWVAAERVPTQSVRIYLQMFGPDGEVLVVQRRSVW